MKKTRFLFIHHELKIVCSLHIDNLAVKWVRLGAREGLLHNHKFISKTLNINCKNVNIHMLKDSKI
jgi:hypothetical protein